MYSPEQCEIEGHSRGWQLRNYYEDKQDNALQEDNARDSFNPTTSVESGFLFDTLSGALGEGDLALTVGGGKEVGRYLTKKKK